MYYAIEPKPLQIGGKDTTQLDLEEYFKRRESLLDSLDPEVRAGLEKELDRSGDSVDKLYRQDRKVLRDVYDARTKLQRAFGVESILKQREINPSLGATPEPPQLKAYRDAWEAYKPSALVRPGAMQAASRFDPDLLPAAWRLRMPTGRGAIYLALRQKS